MGGIAEALLSWPGQCGCACPKFHTHGSCRGCTLDTPARGVHNCVISDADSQQDLVHHFIWFALHISSSFFPQTFTMKQDGAVLIFPFLC